VTTRRKQLLSELKKREDTRK